MIYCEICKKEITEVEVLVYSYDGSDFWITYPLSEHMNGAYVDVDLNWCGEEVDESEIRDCIRCPYCLEYPFKDNEIQTFKYERVIMFKERGAEQKKKEKKEDGIKRCPFCGSDDVRIEEDCPTGCTEIYCADCGVSITRMHEAEAINAWNKRCEPTTKRVRELIDAGLIYPE